MLDILNALPELLEKSLVIVGAASTVATITPTKKDDNVLGFLAAIIHTLAMNFGHAKNKEKK